MDGDSGEVVLEGGSVNRVVRVGETVRRPTGPWTPAVHQLLQHLEREGFEGAPRVLGADEQGREVLTYLDGIPSRRPWPAVLRDGDGLSQLGRWLRRYHEAVGEFRYEGETRWRAGLTILKSDQVVSHGDLGPWNAIWRGNMLMGFIDWDFAEPRLPIEDLAQIAWYCAPLRGEKGWRDAGFEVAPDIGARIDLLCSAYGKFDRHRVLDAVEQLQSSGRDRTSRLGKAGIAPWDYFLNRGDVEKIEAEREWLVSTRAATAETAAGAHSSHASEPTS